MVRSMRKYNKWFMAIGGAILMVAWLIGPSSTKLADMHNNRIVAKLDGKGITARQQVDASKEIDAISKVAPWLLKGLGIEERDSTHWLLLTREAEAAGFVGEGEDGKNFSDTAAMQLARQELNREQFAIYMEAQQKPEADRQKFMQEQQERIIEASKAYIPRLLRGSNLNEEESDKALAHAAGVLRMVQEYSSAPRVSDRFAAAEARKDHDAAITDYVFIPASLTADKVPDPDEATLKAFFEKYKTVKPGEGEYGIGYFFPPRIKLEWLTLNRKAFEDTVVLDPVEVRKRWSQQRTQFPGEFAAERAKVEKQITEEAADKAMQEAERTIHAEVLKATKSLENDGKYKALPADWEQRRPRLESIAQVVQAQAKQAGVNIPLPEVTVKASQWLTLSELGTLPGVGQSGVQQGGQKLPFAEIIGWTRELSPPPTEQVLVPVQTGITIAENPLEDQEGNRYFVTVLATRGESAPDNVDEIKDRVVKDYKNVQAFEALKGRADELRQMAAASGLDAVAAAVDPRSEPPKDADPKDPKKNKPTVEVRKNAAINRERSGGDPSLDDPALRTALLSAAAQIDPHTDWGKADPSKAFVAIPSSKHLGLAVFHILANSPVTEEAYRTMDRNLVPTIQSKELKQETLSTSGPFTLANILKRHTYVANEKVIKSPEDLKKDKGEG